MAHGGGTFVEIVTPLVLRLAQYYCDGWPRAIGGLHVVSLTFPLRPASRIRSTTRRCLVHDLPSWHGYGVTGMSPAWLALVIVAGLVFFPVLGNLRPDLVSFLPSMRQYAGNWASAVWAFAPGTEGKLNAVTRTMADSVDR